MINVKKDIHKLWIILLFMKLDWKKLNDRHWKKTSNNYTFFSLRGKAQDVFIEVNKDNLIPEAKILNTLNSLGSIAFMSNNLFM